MYQKDSIYFGMQHSVKLDPNMRENQNWATFDDNNKGELRNGSEFEWGNDFHIDRKINDDGFENESEFVASPLVFNNKSGSLKERDLYTDKNVTEFEFLPELEVCDRDNHVKDICVDNGVASKENILLDGEICNSRGLESEVQIELGTCECECTKGVGVESTSLEESNPFRMGDDMGLLGKSNGLKSLKALFESRSSDGSDVEHRSDQERFTCPNEIEVAVYIDFLNVAGRSYNNFFLNTTERRTKPAWMQEDLWKVWLIAVGRA